MRQTLCTAYSGSSASSSVAGAASSSSLSSAPSLALPQATGCSHYKTTLAAAAPDGSQLHVGAARLFGGPAQTVCQHAQLWRLQEPAPSAQLHLSAPPRLPAREQQQPQPQPQPLPHCQCHNPSSGLAHLSSGYVQPPPPPPPQAAPPAGYCLKAQPALADKLGPEPGAACPLAGQDQVAGGVAPRLRVGSFSTAPAACASPGAFLALARSTSFSGGQAAGQPPPPPPEPMELEAPPLSVECAPDEATMYGSRLASVGAALPPRNATPQSGSTCTSGVGTLSPGSSLAGNLSPSDALNLGINLEQYISKRNERERSRVRNVNDAFDNLKNSLPLEQEKAAKRMSKVEILRNAIGYIKSLESMLDGYQQQKQQQQQQQQQQQLVSQPMYLAPASNESAQMDYGAPEAMAGAPIEGAPCELPALRQQQQQQQQLSSLQVDSIPEEPAQQDICTAQAHLLAAPFEAKQYGSYFLYQHQQQRRPLVAGTTNNYIDLMKNLDFQDLIRY